MVTFMKTSRVFSRVQFQFAIMCLTTILSGSSSAQSSPFDACQEIADRTARYACYDEVEGGVRADVGAGVGTGVGTGVESKAGAESEVIPAAPVAATTFDSDSAGSQVSTNPYAEEHKPFFRRLLPFGGDDDNGDEVDNPTATATVENKTAGDPVEDFGRTGQRSIARVEADAEGKRELVDSVSGIKLVQHNTLEITLGSGQVWRQMINRRYPLKVGDEVRLRPTGFGTSFRLSAARLDGSGFIQVERIDR